MTVRIGLYFLLIVVGLIVLAWPEQDDVMMVHFSETHGPSALDLVGLALIFTGYIPLIIPVITKFSNIEQTAGRVLSRTLVVIAICCLMLIVVSLMIEQETLLWTMVTISTSAQAVLIYCAVQKSAEKKRL